MEPNSEDKRVKDISDFRKAGHFVDPSQTEPMAPLTEEELRKAGVLPPTTAQPMPSAPFAAPYSYGLQDLNADESQELIPIADLPHKHGWGSELQAAVGGGLKPGEMIGVGAARAGFGKTAFLQQLADGLALRNAELAANQHKDSGQPLTPVLMLSEMDRDALARRTLGRLCEVPSNVFRSGPAAARLYGRTHVEDAFEKARKKMGKGHAYAAMQPWLHVARPETSENLLKQLECHVEGWREGLAQQHQGRDVVPIVVVDPIQRWQSRGSSEVEALNALIEQLDALTDTHKWITLLTSDTNKDSAKGTEDATSSAAVFRGSYKLIHACDVVLIMTSDDPPLNDGLRFERQKFGSWNECERAIRVTIDKNRNGPSWAEACFMLRPACGIFHPEDSAETTRRRSKDKESAEQQKQTAASKKGNSGGNGKTTKTVYTPTPEDVGGKS